MIRSCIKRLNGRWQVVEVKTKCYEVGPLFSWLHKWNYMWVDNFVYSKTKESVFLVYLDDKLCVTSEKIYSYISTGGFLRDFMKSNGFRFLKKRITEHVGKTLDASGFNFELYITNPHLQYSCPLEFGAECKDFVKNPNADKYNGLCRKCVSCVFLGENDGRCLKNHDYYAYMVGLMDIYREFSGIKEVEFYES